MFISKKKYRNICIRLLIMSAFFLIIGVVSSIIAKSLLYFLTWLVISLGVILIGIQNFLNFFFYSHKMAKGEKLEGTVIEYDCKHKQASIKVKTSDNRIFETPKYFFPDEAIKMIHKDVSFFVYKKKPFINDLISK